MTSKPGARAEGEFFCLVVVCYFFLPLASFAAEAPLKQIKLLQLAGNEQRHWLSEIKNLFNFKSVNKEERS
jgi:hypothetical protein